MSPFVAILQTITTQWTKASRGAPGAVRRNRTASTLSIPTHSPPETDEVAWHDVQFNEPEFELEQRVRAIALARLSSAVTGLDLRVTSGALVVDVFGRRQFTVRPGELGEVTFNWVEDVLSDGWRTSVYRKTVARVGHRFEWDPERFASKPDHARNVLRNL